MIVPQHTGWLVSVSYVSGFVAVFTLLVHQVAYLQELGLPARTASFAAGLVGLLGLPGRLLFLLLGNRLRPSFVIAAIFFMLTLSEVLLPSTDEPWRLYLYVGLFGGSFGAVFAASHDHGRLLGLQTPLLALVTAGKPPRRWRPARRSGELRSPSARRYR